MFGIENRRWWGCAAVRLLTDDETAEAAPHAMNQCPKHRQTPPLPLRNKWWGNVATDPDDKAHDGVPDPQGHPLTRRGHIGSSSPAEALKPLWPLPPVSPLQPQPHTSTPTPTPTPTPPAPRGDAAAQSPHFAGFQYRRCPLQSTHPQRWCRAAPDRLSFSKREQARGQRGLPLSEGPWVRHSIPPPPNYPQPTIARPHHPLPSTPTTQYTRQPPLMLVPQGWPAAVCYAIPHTISHHVECIQCSPRIPLDEGPLCFSFPMFFLRKCEIVVLKGGFSGGFSRGLRDFSTFFPGHCTALSTHLQIPSGAGGKGNLTEIRGGGLVPSASSEGGVGGRGGQRRFRGYLIAALQRAGHGEGGYLTAASERGLFESAAT